MSIPREVIPWYPTIDEGLCTNCGVCVDFCPHGVYTMDDVQTIVAAPYSCVVGCSNCASLCTAAAIRFPDLEHFVATLRELRARYGQ
jgi:NAD-dependent dihydropyrimidine dehydrogenase PreA subunit